MGWGGFGRPGGRETTRVGLLSEVGIPLRICLWMGAIGTVMIVGVYVIATIVWVKFWPTTWWPWFQEWWSWHFIPIVLWWITAPPLLLLGRWVFEQVNRNWPPVYAAADPGMGMVGPLWGILVAWMSILTKWKETQRILGIQRVSGRARYREVFEKEEEEDE